ncbi:hypothetical protein IAG44_37355 [Streptomyces roseirectus]|uniref:Uncharacterized protein n=1 Tax=Streptomyces roseirectus TaxID=2768066 RepID=A0A7H0IP53_9ACTN|nr:hypothetical protein [Streptomyces roseirectus]QNP74569.1 hypothetical protein IAG44_37355 [Streptomyces roseirectus]
MTTRSPSVRPNPTAIPGGEVPRTAPALPDGAPHGAAVDGLVRAAVADRPLEELAELITLLEQSPSSVHAASDALRAAGVDRSVEDVTRLVTLLTRPPRPAEGADEIIRAAAEGRPVEDVSRLMALMHRTPLEPHCEEEALRTAATRRPVGELAQLIGRLSEEERAAREAPDRTVVTAPPSTPPEPSAPGPVPQPPAHRAPRPDTPAAEEAATHRPRRWKRGSTGPARDEDTRPTKPLRALAVRGEVPRGTAVGSSRAGTAYDDEASDRLAAARARSAPDRTTRRAGRFTALLLLATGAATLPLHRAGEAAQIYGLTLGAALLCTVLGVLLTIRPAVPLLALALLLPAALAAGQLLRGRMGPASLTRALDLTAAPGWLAGGLAALAALSALTTLLLAAQPTQGR